MRCSANSLAIIFVATLIHGSGPLTTQEVQAAEPTRRDLPLSDIVWTDGFWADRQAALREGALPALSRIMQGTVRSQFLHNFRIAAGLSEGQHRGPGWNDGDTYKWLEALAATYATSHDPALQRPMDAAIEVIAAAQRADGYLHTPVLIANRNGDATARPFGDPVAFEMYNFGHLFTAACVHHEATGERRLLEVAIRAADFLDQEFSRPTPELARHAICPAHYMGAIDLYRTTGDRRFLALVERWLAMRDLVAGGDDNQDRIPFREQREAVGHAVRANYLYAGVTDLCLETGDTSLRPALDACWRSVTDKKLYITGGCGALYDGASPDGSEQQQQITRIHQAYGRNYQLPQATAHNETCAAVGNVLWNHRMRQLTGEARYADVLETSLYNACLAGMSLDGERYFYTNTLRQLDDAAVPLRWSRQREEWISCFCCPPNIVRLLAEVGRYAYAVEGDAVSVLLYGSNRLSTTLQDGSPLQITQTSDYPWDGAVQLQIDAGPARPWALRLRIPRWCEGGGLFVNGIPHSQPLTSGEFISLQREWRAGDRVELQLPMPVRLMSAHPLVEECRGQVAVQRGPLVYCLESTDLPQGARVSQVAIPAQGDWQAIRDPMQLGDVVRLRGDLLVTESRPRGDESTERLYRPYESQSPHTITAELIPYFAWGNRGGSEMTVWIPIRP
jgi:hypothetical protein